MRRTLPLLFFLALSQSAFSQTPLFSNNQPGDPVKLDANMMNGEFVPGVILVKFKDGTEVVPGESQGLKKIGVPTVDAIFKQYQVTSVEQVFKGARPLEQRQILKAFNGYTFERPNVNNIYKLTIKDPERQFDAIQALKSDPNVVYAEPDYVYSVVADKPVSGIITPDKIKEYVNEHGGAGSNPKYPNVVTPNDPLYSQQWGIPAVHADAVWDTTTGDSSQIIAFLDTGVDWHHPDLSANIWTNSSEINGNPNADNDGDGYVYDIHGWDFINNDNDPSDDNGHGTHVAGIACAVGNNSIGIAGVDWHAKIMPIKVFQSSGRGDVATITQGIYYAVKKGATVINMSFGSYARSLTMEDALEYAYGQCVLVAAAGNDSKCIGPGKCFGEPSAPFFPAALSYVLGVQAGDSPPPLGFSNWDFDGPVYSTYQELFNYEIKAPGTNIISTIPNGNYRVYSGTSMATPVVSGAVALYRQLRPTESQELMWGNLINTTSDFLDIFGALAVRPKPSLWFVSNTIVDTLSGDNNNGMVDAGETIQLWFTVRNSGGQSDSVFVGLKLGEFEDTSVAHIINPTAFVGSISPYAKRTNENNPIVIQISPNVAHDRYIVFQASLWYAGALDTITQGLVLTVNHGTYLSGVLDSTLVLTPDRLWIVENSFRVGSQGHLILLPGSHLVNKAGADNRGTIDAIGTRDSLVDIEGPGGFSGAGTFNFKFVHVHDINFSDVFGNGWASGSFDHCYLDNIYSVGPVFGCIVYSVDDCVMENVVNWSNYLFNTLDVTRAYIRRNNVYRSGMLVAPYFYKFALFKWNNIVEVYYPDPSAWFGVFRGVSADLAEAQYYNNFIGYSKKHPAIETDGGNDVVGVPNQYWGTIDSSKIAGMMFDFWRDNTRPLARFQPYLTAPSDSAHGIVWKVLVDGVDPQDQKDLMSPIGVGPHRFDVYFNRPMDTTYTPQLSFGVRLPFTQQSVTDSARWSPDHKIWTAYKTVKLYTGDGINTIRVAGARDLEGFEIPVEDMRFSFLIDAAGTESADFTATPGLGKVRLDWVKPDLSDILGYNMYRFNNITDTTYSDTTLISTKLITDTTFTDFNVTPGKNYYYAYKVVRTDFTESDYSKFVGTKALTSVPGDANGDFAVNVLDVISDVSYILGQNPQPFIFAAADVNADSVINVLDVIGTINLILHPSINSKGPVASVSSVKASKQDATLNLVGDKLWLDSPVMVSGIQLTFAGCKDVKSLTGLEGLNGLEVATARLKGDTAVALGYSMKGNFISAGKTALLQSADKGIHLVSAVLSSADGKTIPVKLYNNGVPVIPETFALFQNYPNPFNPTTTIRYALPKDVSGVEVIFYDVLGRHVRTIDAGRQDKGYHEIVWDGRNSQGTQVASGVYFCQVRVRDGNLLRIIGTTKMMLLK